MSTGSYKLTIVWIILLIIAGILFGNYFLKKLNTQVRGSTRNNEKDGMTQVYIPAGAFIMGSPEDIMLEECQKYRSDCLKGFYADMEPSHTVTINAFWMDKTEVTNAMYALCVTDGECNKPHGSILFGAEGYYDVSAYTDYPVREVTFADAKAYCDWAGRRLPSEAEWEKAARGTDGRLFPWGNQPVTGERGNHCDQNCPRSYRDLNANDGYMDTSPVGQFQAGASPYGVLDLAGNVREWTSSLYLPYPYKPDTGRENLSTQGNRVVRGSHWDGTADFALSAYRFEDSPDYHSTCVGFRCASSQ